MVQLLRGYLDFNKTVIGDSMHLQENREVDCAQHRLASIDNKSHT